MSYEPIAYATHRLSAEPIIHGDRNKPQVLAIDGFDDSFTIQNDFFGLQKRLQMGSASRCGLVLGEDDQESEFPKLPPLPIKEVHILALKEPPHNWDQTADHLIDDVDQIRIDRARLRRGCYFDTSQVTRRVAA